MDGILRDCQQRMDKSVEYFERELRGIRTGRATTALVEYVKVDYYGSPTELREIAAVSVPEPTQLLIKPFDPSATTTIVKAIETADLGLNPIPAPSSIRINVPPPSAERRRQLVGQVPQLPLPNDLFRVAHSARERLEGKLVQALAFLARAASQRCVQLI
ncbi:MAG: ribosome-recycling factor, partial [Planctomycetota bacterium]